MCSRGAEFELATLRMTEKEEEEVRGGEGKEEIEVENIFHVIRVRKYRKNRGDRRK